jgi:hypothetical protein
MLIRDFRMRKTVGSRRLKERSLALRLKTRRSRMLDNAVRLRLQHFKRYSA